MHEMLRCLLVFPAGRWHACPECGPRLGLLGQCGASCDGWSGDSRTSHLCAGDSGVCAVNHAVRHARICAWGDLATRQIAWNGRYAHRRNKFKDAAFLQVLGFLYSKYGSILRLRSCACCWVFFDRFRTARRARVLHVGAYVSPEALCVLPLLGRLSSESPCSSSKLGSSCPPCPSSLPSLASKEFRCDPCIHACVWSPFLRWSGEARFRAGRRARAVHACGLAANRRYRACERIRDCGTTMGRFRESQSLRLCSRPCSSS